MQMWTGHFSKTRQKLWPVTLNILYEAHLFTLYIIRLCGVAKHRRRILKNAIM
jgi:hypothetical protein